MRDEEEALEHPRLTLRTLERLDELEPLLLKNKDHLTKEDQKQIDIYMNHFMLRTEEIRDRCDFWELCRNVHRFEKTTFYELLAKSITKTAETELPMEFREY